MRLNVKHLVPILLLLFISTGINAQWDTTWIKTYGGNRDDMANDIIVTPDNGFLLIGSTSSFGFDNSQMYFLKLDSNGGIMWSKSHGGDGQESGTSVIQTSDGGFLAVGYTNSWGEGGFDVFMVKLDANGNLEYEEVKGGLDWDFAWDVIESAPGKFVIAAETQSFGNGNTDGWLLQFDEATRSWDWETTVGTPETENLKAVAKGNNNDFFAVGLGHANDPSDNDIMMVKFNGAGDSIWTKFYGDTLLDYGNDIIKMADGHYAITGIREFEGFDPGIAVLKVADDGVMDFDTSWTGNDFLFGEGNKVLELPNSVIGVAGTVTFYDGDEDMYLAYSYSNSKIFNKGSSLGQNSTESCNSGVYLNGLGFGIVGHTDGFNGAFTEILMYKTNENCVTYSNDFDNNKDSTNILSITKTPGNNPKLLFNNYTNELTLQNRNNTYEFEIFDLLGRKFSSGLLTNSESVKVTTSNYTPGIYVVIASPLNRKEQIKLLIFIQ